MRHILASMVLVVLLFPALALGETVKFGDLVKREGLYYKKSNDVPFTGKTTGQIQGSFKDGKEDGPWVGYHDNGRVREKGTYKDGKPDGPYVSYNDNGQLLLKGTFKDGKAEGPWVYYHDNGQLWSKGTYKDGKIGGPWVNYKSDGTVWEKQTGTFKSGVKISD